MEFDVEGEKDAETANIEALVDLTVQGSKYAADCNHYRYYPCTLHNYQQNYQNSDNGLKTEGSDNAPKVQAKQCWPYRR